MHNNLRPTIPTALCDERYAKLIERCWSASPNKRPGWDDIIRILSELAEISLDQTSKSNKKRGAVPVSLSNSSGDDCPKPEPEKAESIFVDEEDEGAKEIINYQPTTILTLQQKFLSILLFDDTILFGGSDGSIHSYTLILPNAYQKFAFSNTDNTPLIGKANPEIQLNYNWIAHDGSIDQIELIKISALSEQSVQQFVWSRSKNVIRVWDFSSSKHSPSSFLWESSFPSKFISMLPISLNQVTHSIWVAIPSSHDTIDFRIFNPASAVRYSSFLSPSLSPFSSLPFFPLPPLFSSFPASFPRSFPPLSLILSPPFPSFQLNH